MRTLKKKARLYHLSMRTIQQIDTLAVLHGLPKEQAVAQAVEATYQAAADALKGLKVKVQLRDGAMKGVKAARPKRA